MAKSQKITYPDWPKSRLTTSGNLKRGFDEISSLAFFRGRAIPACRKPELIGILNLLFGGPDNTFKILLNY
jgi:hypothetical protein